MSICAHLCHLWLPLLAAFVPGVRGDEPAVEYTVSLREPQTQYVEMAMRVRHVEGPTLEVLLPVWRPGKYSLLEPATGVTGMRARTGKGRALPCVKVEKSSWLVQTGAPDDDEVVVEYRVYCNQLGERTRHVDDTHAFFSPESVFVYAPEFRDRPARVRVEAPEGWATATGLEPDPSDPRSLLAPGYDVLIDSPLEIGLHDTVKFDVDGTPHEVDVWTGRKDAGLGPGYDKAKLSEQLAKMIRVERDLFGAFPYKRYVFLVHCVPGAGGGTEHLNSTIMQTGPGTFADEAGVKRFMGLAAHEFAHTWNVKQLRPAGLKPLGGLYDLQRENYTDMLWMAEGTTSYIGGMSLVRAGISKPDDYLKSIASWVEAARTRPGVMVQSAAESSFDAWIKFWKNWPDAVNTTVSYYDKGEWVSLVLDMEIRRRTGNRASLDTLMKNLCAKFPLSGPGYTQEDVIRECETLTISSFRDFLASYVTGIKALDFEGALGVAGLEVVHEPAKADGEDGEKESGEETAKEAAGAIAPAPPPPLAPKQKAYIGLNLGADGVVSAVLADGPAYKAGLIAGDVVAAANGQRVKGSADLDSVLKRVKPGEAVTLTFFRYDRLRDVEFRAEGRFDGKWVVRRVKEPTEGQRAVYESWLGQKWPGAGKKE